MSVYEANPEKILYVGRWENVELAKHCIDDYCKAVLLFKGTHIKVLADGQVFCSLDGGPDVEEKEFTTANGIHSLFITAMEGTTFHGVEADELLSPDVYLRTMMRSEYEAIKNGREGRDSSAFAKPEYVAKMPSTGVKLSGFFGDLFNKGVDRVKLCAKYPHHLASYAKRENPHTDWAEWLPGATDGRILAGAGKSYLWTGDEELRAIVDRVVDDIESHTLENGYSNYTPAEKAYGNFYVPNVKNELQTLMDSELKNFDRIFWTYGMVAAGNAGNTKAFELVRKMYDWLASSEYKNTLLYGHNATNAYTGHLVLAKSAVGTEEDIKFHQKYLDQQFLEREFINRNPLTFSNYPGDRPHCYVLLVVLAAIQEYSLTGDPHYLDVALGGWDVYNRYYKHVGGITAICEADGPYLPGSYHMGEKHTGETCASVFWVWINSELAQLFPNEEKYTAEIEEVLFNVVPTIISPGGEIRYHNRMEGTKDRGASDGTCCEIMTTHIYADLPKYVCSYSDSEIYVNQYMNAEINAGDMAITTDADIFANGKFTVTVVKASAKTKVLKVRIPAWAADAKIYINGELVGNGTRGSFETLERIWKEGDTITVTFTPERKTVRYTGAEQINGGNPVPQGPPRYALICGPYLMALTGENIMPHLEGNLASNVPRLAFDPTALEASEASAFSLTLHTPNGLKFVPYHEIDSERFCTFPGYKVKVNAVNFNTAGN